MLNFEETVLNIRKAKIGDERAKELLIEHNSSLLKSIVKRFYKKGVEYEDLYQLACVGFLKAIYNFDETFSVKFSTYAVPMIIGEIKRFLRDDGEVKVSRLIKTLSYKINLYTQSQIKQGKPSPTIKELCSHFEVEKDEVVLAINSTNPLVSLFESVDDGSDKKIELKDKIPSKENEEDLVEKIMLKNAISNLSDRERQIIDLRFYKDKTQQEIARILNISQVQVSRLEKATINKLKQKM